MIDLINVYLSLVIICIGFYGLMTSKNIIKSLLSFNIIEAAIIIFFLDIVSLDSNQVPIYVANIQKMVDPLPQAMMLTTIVIGASITALALMICIKIFHYFGSLEWKEILEREIK